VHSFFRRLPQGNRRLAAEHLIFVLPGDPGCGAIAPVVRPQATKMNSKSLARSSLLKTETLSCRQASTTTVNNVAHGERPPSVTLRAPPPFPTPLRELRLPRRRTLPTVGCLISYRMASAPTMRSSIQPPCP
jgi:hypothetical protein